MSIYFILVVGIVYTGYNATAASLHTDGKIRRDTLATDIDRHPLISVAGGYCAYNSGDAPHGAVAMLGLEYPLDKNRDWNIEIIYSRLFRNQSDYPYDSGLVCFRRYVISQEYDIRPSFHLGLGAGGLDIGAGIDFTILRRLLYSQLCGRVPISIGTIIGHLRSESKIPRMITLSARIMV